MSSMHFDQFAGDYKQILDETLAISGEDSAYFAEYKARYLARILSRDFSGKVLDFGCGIGLLSGFLKQHLPKSRIDGFDVSRESLDRVHSALVEQGLFTSNSDLLAGDYDLIVLANVMHHIVVAQRQMVIEDIAGHLAPHGKLAIFEHNPANPVTRRVVDRCPFDKHVTLLAPSETSQYLRKARLRLVRTDYIVFMPRLLSCLRPLERCLAWLPLGAQYALSGEKHV